MVAGPRLRVLVWNLNGNPDALDVAVEWLTGADGPALALLTEVPDRPGLGLAGRVREVSKRDLERWVESRCAAKGGSSEPIRVANVHPTAATTTNTSTGANKSHAALLYRGPGELRALPAKPGDRHCRARLTVAPAPITLVVAHLRSARTSESAGNDGEDERAAAELASQWRRAGEPLVILGGDLNAEPWDRSIATMSGLLALAAPPRNWPAKRKSYLANLTWSAIHWGSGGTFWDNRAHRWHWLDQLIVHRDLASGAKVTALRHLCGHDVVKRSLSDHLPMEAILAVELSHDKPSTR